VGTPYHLPHHPDLLEEKYMGILNVGPRARKRKPARFGIETGIGNAGDVLKGLGGFIEFLSEMEEKGKEKTERRGEINLPDGKAMYGFSVKIGGAGIPRVEHFGNIIRNTDKGTIVDEVREPLVDIFEEGDKLQVIAELPGVEEKDISYEIKDDVLILNAAGESRTYTKEVLLPARAVILKSAYKNGVFRLTLKKEAEEK